MFQQLKRRGILGANQRFEEELKYGILTKPILKSDVDFQEKLGGK